MKIGLYGGSFDPIHRGHVEPILEAELAAGLDRVIYLPTARPPHKESRRLAPAEHRFAMVELALSDHPQLEVSRFEMGLAGPSYTVETLEHFRSQRPADELHLLIGADSFLSLDRWHRYQELPALARLVVLVRPGWKLEPRSEVSSWIHRLAEDPAVIWVKNQQIDASSTEIRRLLSIGEPVPADWLTEPVLNYIRRFALYVETA